MKCATCATLYQAEVGGDALLATLYDKWLPADLNGDYQADYDWLVANAEKVATGTRP